VHIRKRLALLSAAAAALPAVAVGIIPGATPAAHAASGGIKVGYYDQWSIYTNAFYPKNLDTTGMAGKLDYLIYDFENINPTTLQCFEATKSTDPDPAGENDPNAGDGAEDQFADMDKSFGADISVNGQADA